MYYVYIYIHIYIICIERAKLQALGSKFNRISKRCYSLSDGE